MFGLILQNINACDTDGREFESIELPRGFKPIGPSVNNNTLLQSVATALHVNNSQAISGQTGSKSALSANAGVYLNPEQPLMYAFAISDDDIKHQEDRVTLVRKKLQEALKN